MYDRHLNTKEDCERIQDLIEDYIAGVQHLAIEDIANEVQDCYEDDRIKSAEYDNFMSQLEELGLEM